MSASSTPGPASKPQSSKGWLTAGVLPVAALPHTRTGKRLEVPVKRILLGQALSDAVDPDAVDDAGALQQFVELAAAR